jgi:predicted Fe-S protein YdhL (DUF1289 family)
MDEIARWGAMGHDEQWDVLRRVARRRIADDRPVDRTIERALRPK